MCKWNEKNEDEKYALLITDSSQRVNFCSVCSLTNICCHSLVKGIYKARGIIIRTLTLDNQVLGEFFVNIHISIYSNWAIASMFSHHSGIRITCINLKGALCRIGLTVL